jgi:hypothetical protein
MERRFRPLTVTDTKALMAAGGFDDRYLQMAQ